MKGAPLREDLLAKGQKPSKPNMLQGTFRNTGKDPALKEADLWYDESMFWGKLGHGDPPLVANTYAGHRWNVRVDGQIVKKFVVGTDLQQVFEI
jgi:hypothetical protein